MTKVDKEVADLIPIADSVRLLDEKYEHLRNIAWNQHQDEEEKEKE